MLRRTITAMTHPYDNDGANYNYNGSNIHTIEMNQIYQKRMDVVNTSQMHVVLKCWICADSNAVLKGLPINA